MSEARPWMSSRREGFDTLTYRDGRLALDLLACSTLIERGVPHGFSFRYRRRKSATTFGAKNASESDRRILARVLALDSLAYMKQVHGSRVSVADRAGEIGECDGIVSGRAGVGLMVASADCVPVLFWDAKSNRAGACHAGWRGTRARVAAATLKQLVESSDAQPRSTHAVIGPSIQKCCFEVGDEVLDAFRAEGFEVDRLIQTGEGPRAHLDLVAANRVQLEEAGIPPDQIYESGRCTKCENDAFYSYRAEGRGVGRVVSVIAPRPAA